MASFNILPRLLSLFVVVALLLAQPHPLIAQSATTLYNDQPMLGFLSANVTAYYRFVSPAVSYQQTALISMSATIGSPTMYVSLTNPTPSPASFDYQASWLTGGVVSVQVQPPYTAYVAVQSSLYSACNYSVLVTTYETGAQLNPLALSSAVPLASLIAAGEYRYFAYNVTNGAASFTVALTETYGQSYLLINSPNTTALPTLSSYQYSSTSPTFPLIALQQPTAGVWTVGVWSNSSSAFSVMAVNATSLVSMELGVTYPGWVGWGEYSYYSIYIDALSLNSSGYLDLELYSVTGDADLFCSYTTTQPSQTNAHWASTNAQPQDSLPIQPSQLRAGTLYCGVNGFLPSYYTFSASYSSATILTAGETVTAESPAGSSRLYSMVLPATTSLVTLSVVSEVGLTTLFIGGYGAPPNGNSFFSSNAASVHLMSLYPWMICGTNNALAIPGSNPLMCQLQVNVINWDNAVYHITATAAGQIVELLPGVPAEGAVSPTQPAIFSFTVPDDLSNATLIFSITSGTSTSAVLTVGRNNYGAISNIWTITPQPDTGLFVFQLDWTNSLLPALRRPGGQWVATLSAADGNLTLSALYTVTNGSAYSASIVQLSDGVSQAGVIAPNDYGFFYFVPPSEGWPYSVVVTVIWQSGFGTIALGTSEGPSAHLPWAYSLAYGSDQVTMTPESYGVCNPTLDPSCGYAIRLTGSTSLPSTSVYSITIATSNWVRFFYVNGWRTESDLLAFGVSDYWMTSVNPYAAVNPQLLIAVTVWSGTVSIFGSNVTGPNATTAQVQVPNVSTAGILSLPLVSYVQSYAYVTVTCASNDTTPCKYTLEANTRDDTDQVSWLQFFGSGQITPVDLLLPAGGLAWVPYFLGYSPISIASVFVQASAVVGSTSLYAVCSTWFYSGTPPPLNASAVVWQGDSSPTSPSLELTNLTVSDNCSTLMVAVQAGSDQAALITVIVSVGGVLEELSYNMGGYVSAVYPTSYYQYLLPDDDPSVVLTFTLQPGYWTRCAYSQLRMLVSDRVMYPDPTNPDTYNYSMTAVNVSSTLTEFTIAITNYSQPAGMLRLGYYYIAVTNTVPGTNCEYTIGGSNNRQRDLVVGEPQWQGAGSASTPSYFTFTPVAYNSSTSFAMQLVPNTGVVMLYVGVNNTPSPADPSTYLIVISYDTSLYTSIDPYSGRYSAQPIYVPASACASSTQPGQSCGIVFMSVSSYAYYQDMWMLPMSSASATSLIASLPVSSTASSGPSCASSVTAYPGYDLAGNDLFFVSQPAVSFSACQDLCCQDCGLRLVHRVPVPTSTAASVLSTRRAVSSSLAGPTCGGGTAPSPSSRPASSIALPRSFPPTNSAFPRHHSWSS